MNCCVIIPCFNHATTLPAVAQAAREHCPVLIVDDGSTVPLPPVPGCLALRLDRRRGKGSALQLGFQRARELGYSHGITMDADGQHCAADLPQFLRAARQHARNLLVGIRDLQAAGCPPDRRWANRFSSFWFRVGTGIRLADTQCGFRCYPLEMTQQLQTRSGGFAFEYELLVRACWTGPAIIPLPVQCSYLPEQLRQSQFRPGRDLARLTLLNLVLLLQFWFVPQSLRQAWSRGEKTSWRTIANALFARPSLPPAPP